MRTAYAMHTEPYMHAWRASERGRARAQVFRRTNMYIWVNSIFLHIHTFAAYILEHGKNFDEKKTMEKKRTREQKKYIFKHFPNDVDNVGKSKIIAYGKMGPINKQKKKHTNKFNFRLGKMFRNLHSIMLGMPTLSPSLPSPGPFNPFTFAM